MFSFKSLLALLVLLNLWLPLAHSYKRPRSKGAIYGNYQPFHGRIQRQDETSNESSDQGVYEPNIQNDNDNESYQSSYEGEPEHKQQQSQLQAKPYVSSYSFELKHDSPNLDKKNKEGSSNHQYEPPTYYDHNNEQGQHYGYENNYDNKRRPNQVSESYNSNSASYDSFAPLSYDPPGLVKQVDAPGSRRYTHLNSPKGTYMTLSFEEPQNRQPSYSPQNHYSSHRSHYHQENIAHSSMAEDVPAYRDVQEKPTGSRGKSTSNAARVITYFSTFVPEHNHTGGAAEANLYEDSRPNRRQYDTIVGRYPSHHQSQPQQPMASEVDNFWQKSAQQYAKEFGFEMPTYSDEPKQSQPVDTMRPSKPSAGPRGNEYFLSFVEPKFHAKTVEILPPKQLVSMTDPKVQPLLDEPTVNIKRPKDVELKYILDAYSQLAHTKDSKTKPGQKKKVRKPNH